MKIEVRSTPLARHADEAVVLFAHKDEDQGRAMAMVGGGYAGAYDLLRRRKAFTGDAGQVRVLHGAGRRGTGAVVLAGLGPAGEATAETLREAASGGTRAARDAGARSVTLVLPASGRAWARADRTAQAAVEGAILGLYRFQGHKTEKAKTEVERLTLLAARGGSRGAAKGARVGEIVAGAVAFARDLGNEPGNVATPTYLAETAQRLGAETGLGVKVLGREEMERLGMGAFLGVAKGSAEPPRLIVLTYDPPRRRGRIETVALVGKGLTFDSGGISIKPSAKMEDMKFDMCGGAAVLATLRALPALGVPVRVVGLVGATENMPGGRAYKPGDILKAMNGTTIEVRNTDAEGRLVLADVLAYASSRLRPRPRAIVDLATLTGACVVALGDQHAGLMGNDDALVERIQEAAEASGDPVWRLPLKAGYRKQLESPYADVSNLGTGGAGTITAAHFLEKFVGEVPWAHLDIAGMAWTERQNGYVTKGGTGFGVRLLCRLLLGWGRR